MINQQNVVLLASVITAFEDRETLQLFGGYLEFVDNRGGEISLSML
jgi:hypothetical protein